MDQRNGRYVYKLWAISEAGEYESGVGVVMGESLSKWSLTPMMKRWLYTGDA